MESRKVIQPTVISDISEDSDDNPTCPEDMSPWCEHDVDEELVEKYDASSKEKGKYPDHLIPHQALEERKNYTANCDVYKKLYIKKRMTPKENVIFWNLVEES